MEKDNFINLTDSDGTEMLFEVISHITYKEQEYAVLLSAEFETDEYVILRMQTDDTGEIDYVGIDNTVELDAVYDEFMRRTDEP